MNDETAIKSVSAVVLSLCVLFVLDHVGRRNNVAFIRISTYLKRLYDVLSPWVWRLGCVVADLISFLNLLDFSELAITMYDIAIPTFNLATIWVDFVNAISHRLYQHNSMAFIGGFCILFLVTHLVNVNPNVISTIQLFVISCALYYAWTMRGVDLPQRHRDDADDIIEVDQVVNSSSRPRRRARYRID